MFYEVTSIVTRANSDGFDKEYKEKFFIENCEFFAEAEVKMLEYYNNENSVTAIKQSKVREFVNKRSNDDEHIYIATIEDIFIDEDSGEEKRTKYEIGLFAKNVNEATRLTNEYLRQGMNDFELVKVSKTKFLDII